MPPEPKGLSIASLCCGIAAFVGLGFFLLPQLAAVILGHMALKREPSGKGMAIAGLVMGYVGIALALLVIVVIALGLAIGTQATADTGRRLLRQPVSAAGDGQGLRLVRAADGSADPHHAVGDIARRHEFDVGRLACGGDVDAGLKRWAVPGAHRLSVRRP